MIAAERLEPIPVLDGFNLRQGIVEISVAHDLQEIQVGFAVIAQMRRDAGIAHGLFPGEMEPQSHRNMVHRLFIHGV